MLDPRRLGNLDVYHPLLAALVIPSASGRPISLEDTVIYWRRRSAHASIHRQVQPEELELEASPDERAGWSVAEAYDDLSLGQSALQS